MSIKLAVPKQDFWSLHSHSRFSVKDALPDVKDMVATVAAMRQPALGLTDHGNMAGSVQLYQHCAKAGIKPFPGTEFYIVRDRADKKAKRHHVCVVAYTTQGYQNLVALNTKAAENFYNKPLLDLIDLAAAAEAGMTKGLALTSGCYFSLVSQAVVTGERDEAKRLLACFAAWFDPVYVELQNHGIDHGDGWNDDKLADELYSIANEMGLPCVLTQDSHYCDKGDKDVHEGLKRLVAFGPDADDAVFPGDSFHLADQGWLAARHHPARFRAGLDGLTDLLDRHDLTIKQLDTYHYNIPFTVAEPDIDLYSTCERRIAYGGYDSKYMDRLTEELEVIKFSRMAGYLLLVQEVTDYCKANNIFVQARGSASGSLACYALGITQIDPIKWGIRFERFLSKDRTKPPDIDLDVEHWRRGDVIEWLSERFNVVQIGTWAEASLKGDDETSKGSLRVQYFSRMRKSGLEIKDWASVPQEDKDILYRLSDAKSFTSFGTHAAGLVITTTAQELEELVPMMWIASSKTLVTQYEMNDIEALGLVKLDLLGLKTLSVLNLCVRQNLGKEDLSWMPLDDKPTYEMIRSGDTAGVFQLEGWTASRGCQDLKPTSISDVIASMALFRPATMKSGATASYIRRKHKKEARPKRHEIIERNTKSTQGIMLFQEQVIAILRELGMQPDDLTKFLKAVKASNENIGDAAKVIESFKVVILDMAQYHGMSEDDWDWLWAAIEGFAKYGFNLAHSTAYGLTAYRCAYLAVNYKVPFHAALLAVAAGTDKEDDYVKTTRKRGVRILPADINDSGVSYAVDPRGRGVRRGLVSVKGLGEKSAIEIVEQRPPGGYADLKDLCERVNHRKVTGVKAYLEDGDCTVGVIGKLDDSGALNFGI